MIGDRLTGWLLARAADRSPASMRRRAAAGTLALAVCLGGGALALIGAANS